MISIHSLIRGRTTIQPIGEPLNACISIHSLIRGRTQPRKSVSLLYRISIHSLIRGRTLTNAADCNSHGKFQSTPSYEGEPVSEPISSLTSYFNPLPHTRENVNTILLEYAETLFQSTPSYEGEPSPLFHLTPI